MRHLGLRYEGPIYRPPSEAHSLLVQATVGCPHNLCTFCTVYKGDRAIKFRIRSVQEIKEDIGKACEVLGSSVRTVFFPAGNTIIMKTDDLVEILEYTSALFPRLERITIYASSQYVARKGFEDMKRLADAGLSRVHVGLESGDDETLLRIRKGSTSAIQIEAGKITINAGIELNTYIMLGIGGKERSEQHVRETIRVLNEIDPNVVRLRTFLPKVDTPILKEIENQNFTILTPHEVLQETYDIIRSLDVSSEVTSDHYTNYIDVHGNLPEDRNMMLRTIEKAKKRNEGSFRPVYLGDQ